MVTRIRQIVALAENMEESAALYSKALGLEVNWRTEMPLFGLIKLVMPTGNETFLEILQPVDDKSRAWKFLHEDRAKGGKFFSLIVETDDIDTLLSRAEAANARISTRMEGSEASDNKAAFMHPLGMNGVLIEILQPPKGRWPNAGPEESQKVAPGAVVNRLRQVVVLVRDLEEAIHRWSTLFNLGKPNRLHVPYGDLDVAILPFSNTGTFVELATPTSKDSSAARYLEQFDEGLYMAVFETGDMDKAEAKIRDCGDAAISQTLQPNPGYRHLWIHPRSMKDIFIQITEVTDPINPWPPGGPDWYK
jgi:methylmalonyl-CoA/ethylmalonyl-CoA epimerase